MKTTYVLSVIVCGLLFTSCASIPMYSEHVYSIDFRKYSEQGFIITPTDNINREYTSLADIEMVFTFGYTEKKIVTRRGFSQSEVKDDLYIDKNTLRSKKPRGDNWFTPTPEYVLDQFVQYAKSIGADAIVNFKSIKIESFPGKVTLSGFAIKILD